MADRLIDDLTEDFVLAAEQEVGEDADGVLAQAFESAAVPLLRALKEYADADARVLADPERRERAAQASAWLEDLAWALEAGQ